MWEAMGSVELPIAPKMPRKSSTPENHVPQIHLDLSSLLISALLSRQGVSSHQPITLIIRCPPGGDRWHPNGGTPVAAPYKLIRETALTSRCDCEAEKIGQSYESTAKHINLIGMEMRGGDGNQLLLRRFYHVVSTRQPPMRRTRAQSRFVLPLEKQRRDDNRPQSYFCSHNQMARRELKLTSLKMLNNSITAFSYAFGSFTVLLKGYAYLDVILCKTHGLTLNWNRKQACTTKRSQW